MTCCIGTLYAATHSHSSVMTLMEAISSRVRVTKAALSKRVKDITIHYPLAASLAVVSCPGPTLSLVVTIECCAKSAVSI